MLIGTGLRKADPTLHHTRTPTWPTRSRSLLSRHFPMDPLCHISSLFLLRIFVQAGCCKAR